MTKHNTKPPRDAIERAVRHQFDTLGAGDGTQFYLEYEGAYYKVTAVKIATVKRMDNVEDGK